MGGAGRRAEIFDHGADVPPWLPPTQRLTIARLKNLDIIRWPVEPIVPDRVQIREATSGAHTEAAADEIRAVRRDAKLTDEVNHLEVDRVLVHDSLGLVLKRVAADQEEESNHAHRPGVDLVCLVVGYRDASGLDGSANHLPA
jgi:hypothetical protein